MKTRWAIAYSVAFGVVCGFLGSGLLYMVSSPPRGYPVRLAPSPSPQPVIVHVAGSVAKPGLYTLPQGARVEDAVAAAGGFLPAANLHSLNLAARLEDGDRVYIPVVSTAASYSGSSATSVGFTALVNVNSAGKEALETLPGIGPALAGRIIAFREENGAFQNIEDIQKVQGIGPSIFNRLKDLISIEDQP